MKINFTLHIQNNYSNAKKYKYKCNNKADSIINNSLKIQYQTMLKNNKKNYLAAVSDVCFIHHLRKAIIISPEGDIPQMKDGTYYSPNSIFLFITEVECVQSMLYSLKVSRITDWIHMTTFSLEVSTSFKIMSPKIWLKPINSSWKSDGLWQWNENYNKNSLQIYT